MNLIEIIALLAVVAAGYLYWSERGKRKNLARDSAEKITRLQDVITGGKAENLRISGMLSELRQTIKERDESINAGKFAYDKLFKDSEDYKEGSQKLLVRASKAELELEELRKELEELRGAESIQTIAFDAGSTLTPFGAKTLLDSLPDSDRRIKNTAILSLGGIELNANEMVKDDYIKVIKKLNEIGLFPEHLERDFSFNPKSMKVNFALIRYDEEGEPIGFKGWDDFLLERNSFVQTVTAYVESVINQKKINEAVNLALSGKEVASV